MVHVYGSEAGVERFSLGIGVSGLGYRLQGSRHTV